MSSILRLSALSLPVLFVACTSKSESRISSVAPGELLKFREVHAEVGLTNAHVLHSQRNRYQPMTGGVACADYDGDGFQDLYVVGGDLGNYLYKNEGGKGFRDVSVEAGVRLAGGIWSGCTFADINGDGQIDLFLTSLQDQSQAESVRPTPCILLQNNGKFSDATPGSGLDKVTTDTFSSAFADYDNDGDLDLFVTHYLVRREGGQPSQHLWRNEGNAKFTDVSAASGVTAAFATGGSNFTDLSFTPNFVDVDNDGDLDLLITGDLGTNLVLVNTNGTFRAAETATKTDHASGAAIGDYNNDGQLDWFVSGIDGAGRSGNALLRNEGDGQFANVTVGADVGTGGWGWAASMGDFDNDGFLDIVQTNGFGASPDGPFRDYFNDPVRLFLNGRGGVFQERAAELELIDNNLGRGLVVFDFDRDGDLDVFIVNFFGEPSLWMNEGGDRHTWLATSLKYTGANPRGIGARVEVFYGDKVQVREVRAGCNYMSQNPAECHFGLETALKVDRIVVTWPNGQKTERTDVDARQRIEISYQ